jgi:predicted phosphodiesterase
MRLLFLGDIHGDFGIIHKHIKLYDIKDAHIIQVGDFGLGFQSIKKEKRLLEMYHQKLVNNNVFVWAIRGNHDYKPYFDNDPFGLTNIKLIPDYTVLNLCNKNILCIGGAVSVDRSWRMTKNQKLGIHDGDDLKSWWHDEVFNLDIDKLSTYRDIDVVVTHTAPHYCPVDNICGFGPFVEGIINRGVDDKLKTDLLVERNQLTQAFQILKENNNIQSHIYGHFHKSDFVNVDGTEHRVLDINELWEEKSYINIF